MNAVVSSPSGSPVPCAGVEPVPPRAGQQRVCAPTGAAAAARLRAPSKGALGGLSLAVLLSTLNTSIVNVALPTLTTSFRVSPQVAQWTVIAYVLAITTLIVSAGQLADVVGRRRLLLLGIAVFTAAGGGCAFVPSLGWLIALRFVQGIGAAVMMALSVALVGALTARDTAGRSMGLLGSMSAIGTALGPALGGILIASFGWRAIFVLNLPLGFAALALLSRALPDDNPAGAKTLKAFDGRGTVLLASTLAAYALALTRYHGRFGGANLALLAAAVGGLILFGRAQKRSAAPLLRLEVLQAGSLRSGLIMSLLVAAVMMSTLVVGPYYLAQVLALDLGTVGVALSVGPVVAAIVASPAGRWVDRIGSWRTAVLGLTGAAAGCLALALLPERWGIFGYVIPVAVLTAGYSLFQTANNTAVMHSAPADQRGLVSGWLNLSRNLGLVTGAALLGGVFAVGSASATPAAAQVAFALRLTFAVATAFVLAALVLALRERRRRQRDPEAATSRLPISREPSPLDHQRGSC